MRPAAIVFALGFAVSLTGDAAHVASGTTRYEWDGIPVVWRSAIWFPFLVAAAVTTLSEVGRRLQPAVARIRTPRDVVPGAAAVLGLYALTAALRGQPDTVSVVLTAAVAVLVWAWWDPTPATALAGVAAAVLGPLAEMGVVAAGAASYAPDADGLGGVAPWLPCLYFAAGAVALRLGDVLKGSGRRAPGAARS